MASAKSNSRSGSKSRSSSTSKGRSSSSATSRSSKTSAAARGRGGSPRARGRSSSSSAKTNPNARSGSRAGGAARARGSSRSKAGSQTTTDHEQIRQWAEARGGKPSCVRGTGGVGDTGMLRLDFPGYTGADSLQEISWDEWFEQFDDQRLALLYQETTKDGQQSNFNKLVSRATASKSKAGRGGASRSRAKK
jgi:hypothetical protein